MPERGVDRKDRITDMANRSYNEASAELLAARFFQFPNQERLTVDRIPAHVKRSIKAGGQSLQVGMVQNGLDALHAAADVGIVQVDVRRHTPGPVLGPPDVGRVSPEGGSPPVQERHHSFQRPLEQQVVPTTPLHPGHRRIEAIVDVSPSLPKPKKATVGSGGEPVKDVNQGPEFGFRNKSRIAGALPTGDLGTGPGHRHPCRLCD